MIVDRIPLFTNSPNNEFEKEVQDNLNKFTDDVNLFSRLAYQINIGFVISNVDVSKQNILLVDCTGGNITLTLPYASQSTTRFYTFKKIDISANNMIIQPQSGETIDGAVNITTNTQYKSYGIITDKSNWFIISEV